MGPTKGDLFERQSVGIARWIVPSGLFEDAVRQKDEPMIAWVLAND
jgi:hypothetical protein